MERLVIIPTYNEKENIEAIITAVMELPIMFHVLVIDDGSPDGTADIVKRMMKGKYKDCIFLIERAGKQGLGTAYIAGFRWAIEHKADYIFEMDADFSHNPQDLIKLYDACAKKGADLSIGSRYVSGVGTNQVSNIIAAAYACGVRSFDVKTAYEAALKNELDGKDRPMGAGKLDTDRFVELGYVPHKDKGEWPDEAWMFSASHTLEYSFSAYAVAQMARELGHDDDYARLMELSRGWEKIYDEDLNLVHPKWENGEFIGDFDPMQVWRGFQEGNAYQYTFYVPHDPKALIAKMGAEEFSARLDSIFARSKENIFSGGKTIDAFAGLRTYYNQGNQPCLHISWLFNQAGHPSLTQKWVRAILDDFYGTDGIHGYGYGQDEDQGQLGAWYVISSMGLFDVAGLCDSDPVFALGSPKFDKVTISLDKDYYPGDRFEIVTRNNGEGNIYASEYKLDGKSLNSPSIPFKSVVSGGRLEVVLGSTPKDSY